MKKQAYSYIEIIISIFLVLFIILPSLKVSSQQLKINTKANSYNDSLIFFSSLVNYLKTREYIISEDIHIENYEDFKENSLFNDFDIKGFKGNNFSLDIKVKKINVDFHIKNIDSNLILITFKNYNNEIFNKILVFD